MKVDNSILMLIATVATFLFLGLLIFFPIPDKNTQIVLAFGSFVLGFYFGSSVNKNRKEITDEKTADTPDTPAGA